MHEYEKLPDTLGPRTNQPDITPGVWNPSVDKVLLTEAPAMKVATVTGITIPPLRLENLGDHSPIGSCD
jgi:hypothetical protein